MREFILPQGAYLKDGSTSKFADLCDWKNEGQLKLCQVHDKIDNILKSKMYETWSYLYRNFDNIFSKIGVLTSIIVQYMCSGILIWTKILMQCVPEYCLSCSDEWVDVRSSIAIVWLVAIGVLTSAVVAWHHRSNKRMTSTHPLLLCGLVATGRWCQPAHRYYVGY
jgi:hypothetical protein